MYSSSRYTNLPGRRTFERMGRGWRKGCILHFGHGWVEREMRNEHSAELDGGAQGARGKQGPRTSCGMRAGFRRSSLDPEEQVALLQSKRPKSGSLPPKAPQRPHFFYLLIIYPETLFMTPPCACSHVVFCLLNKIQCLKPGLSHHRP